VKIDCQPARKETVAIIGSGPAGLSAAYHLAKRGIQSTIFEALPKAGGMLRVGIPEHRLPREVLDKDIEVITNLGVEIRCNTPIGETPVSTICLPRDSRRSTSPSAPTRA
jgi:NADPH-dependent glutamate synthase beta subunit-like oxidoreductase